MQISCTICRELFSATQCVFITGCGHLYHEQCILQWSIRKKTCPQCRSNLKNQPFRVYFNTEELNGDDENDDLQSKLEVATDKLFELQQQLNTLRRENANLSSENAALVDDKNKLILDKDNKAGAIIALKSKILSLQHENEKLLETKAALKKAQSELLLLQGVKKVIMGTREEVKKSLESLPCTEQTIHHLCTHIEVLKEHSERNSKRIKNIHESHQVINNHLKSRIKELEERIESMKSRTPASPMPMRDVVNIEPVSCAKAEDALTVLEDFSSVQCVKFIDKLKVKRDEGTTSGQRVRHGILPSKRLLDSKSTTRLSSTFNYDGMGGSKRVSLVNPLSRGEIAAIKTQTRSSGSQDAKRRKENQQPLTNFIELD